jgi:ABC-type transport system involved in cytochrome c biogenesis ATPase subunit
MVNEGGSMQVVLDGVAVDGRREPLLATMDLAWSTGEAVLVAAEPGHGHTALALAATGRLAPSAGRVLVDGGEAEPAALRTVSAVVDVPGVNEPDDALTLADVVAEGLALAGRPSRPRDVRAFLDERALSGDRDRRVDQVSGAVRTSVLAGLAVADPAVRFVVLTLPDRHGGDPAGWWDLARGLAATGLGVLVGCTRSSARDLGVELPPAVGDSRHAPPRAVRRETFSDVPDVAEEVR